MNPFLALRGFLVNVLSRFPYGYRGLIVNLLGFPVGFGIGTVGRVLAFPAWAMIVWITTFLISWVWVGIIARRVDEDESEARLQAFIKALHEKLDG